MAKPGSRYGGSNIGPALSEAAALYQQGRLDEAEKICARILKAAPEVFDALHLLGLLKLRQGKAGAAYGLITDALKLNPDWPDALSNLGLALAALNRDAEALTSFDRALALAPDSFEVLNNRGNVLLKLRRPAEALAAYERVVELEPRHLGARSNRGNALAELGRLDEALKQYDAVLAAQPGHAETEFNRGNALSMLGRHADAIAAYDRALAARPHYINALLNRAIALQTLGRHQEALGDFRQVLAIDKDNADAHHNEALVLLTLGDYRRGFEKYEYRWQRTGMPARRRNLGKPLWRGEYPLQRKTILLHAEQGLGDTIQFARYAPILARNGAKVVLEVQPELAGLLARLDGVTAVVAREQPLPAFDLHCPFGTLPLALKTEPAAIPAGIPYLTASEERIAQWRPRIESIPGPRVAIAWSGRATHANDRNRSITLDRLAPLLASESARFISIQRDLRAGEEDALKRYPNLMHVGDALDDFDDTAAVMSLVDLVIAVDTSVVHLAGALGRPVWILVPSWPDWRWMLERTDSPWYPTARLFRQPSPGDWDSVIAQAAKELAKGALGRSPHPEERTEGSRLEG